LSSRRLPEDVIIGPVNPIITHATVIGRLIPQSNEDYMRLARLAWSFKRAVELMVREVASGASMKEATKSLYSVLPNYVYLESAYKHAELIVEGCRFNNGNPRHVHVRRLFIVSRGNKHDYGNRNVRLMPNNGFFEALVRYPWDNSWIRAKAIFGERYIPLLSELVELARGRLEGYGAKIVFKGNGLEIHISVPIHLYLKYFSLPKRQGYGLIAGIDLNSDRLNIVVIDCGGRIVSLKSSRFPEVVRHGFPRNKARDVRLKMLKKMLVFARNIGVDYVAFENLFLIRKRSKVSSPSGNRKIARFAKRQLLTHGIVMALKLGLTPILVNPRGTTHSEEHRRIMRERGLDRHMASAYLTATKGLEVIKSNEKLRER